MPGRPAAFAFPSTCVTLVSRFDEIGRSDPPNEGRAVASWADEAAIVASLKPISLHLAKCVPSRSILAWIVSRPMRVVNEPEVSPARSMKYFGPGNEVSFQRVCATRTANLTSLRNVAGGLEPRSDRYERAHSRQDPGSERSVR